MAADRNSPIPDLLLATADLVAIPSESHAEEALADHVEARLREIPGLGVERIASNVVARTETGKDTRVVLAGHLDTVPANGNTEPKIDGNTLWGLGSADMKGGLSVMLALAAAITDPLVDVTYVFYSGEEVSREHSGLLRIEAVAPELLHADAAVLGEPTGARIEAGCQGVLRLEVDLGGRRAHAARPWMGINAVQRLGPLLDRVAAYESRQPVIDGCQYREALQAVRVSGGVAGNVVPDRATRGAEPPIRSRPGRSGSRGLGAGPADTPPGSRPGGSHDAGGVAARSAAVACAPITQPPAASYGAAPEGQAGLDRCGLLL